MSDTILPSQIHRYELVERIAVGGMAEVFRAKTFGVQGFEKQLAVKRILPELAANREFVDRFVGEAKIAVTLNHANIVQILDFSRFGDSLFIAMEYIDGCDLSALLKGYRKQGKTLPVAAALHISIELLKGLDFAHGRDVVHRDMSPANVLVSKSGEVKIADFGIAQAAGDGSGHTNPFQIMGKWRYMSPEQTRAEPLTAASDLFSTAIMLHEAFTGHRLFDQDEPAEIVKAIREEPIPRLRDLRPELSATLDAIVQHGLERDPAKRGSASTMMRALIEFSYAQSLPVTAMDLADVVKEFTGGPGDGAPTAPSDTGQLIDDIINSELQHRRPGCQTRLTRITPPKAQADAGSYDDAVTGLTFVDGGLGPDGLTQWLVADAEGGPVAIESDMDFDIATVSRAAGGSQVTPTTRFELAQFSPPAALAENRGGEPRRWPIAAAALGGSLLAALIFLLPGASRDRERAPATAEASPPSSAALAVAEQVDASRRAELTTVLAPTSPDELVMEPDVATTVELVVRSTPTSPDELVMEPDVATTVELVVRSTPAGASVQLAGKHMGATPLTLSVARSEQPVALGLHLPGFRDHTQFIDLGQAGPVRIRERLRREVATSQTPPPMGRIDVFVKPWANVYFRGSKIAEAPARGIRLPHGTHRLRLENPVTGQSRTVTVEVPSSKPYRFTLQGGS